jgi:hypothetical protein
VGGEMTADTEAKLYKWMTRHLPNANMMRIESYTIQGIPDVYICTHIGQAWVELKILRGNIGPLLRKQQYAWGLRHHKHGGLCVLLARKGDTIMRWEYPHVEIIPRGQHLMVTNDPVYVCMRDVQGESELVNFIMKGKTQ